MIFSSACFILFLMIVVSIYYVVPIKLRHIWLLMASYIFCLSYDVNAVIVLAGTTLVSYLFGCFLDKIKTAYQSKTGALICLWSGIICCVFPLVCGKIGIYSLFAVMGISFYTLQEIAYLIDIYCGKNQAEKNFVKYALFIAFFPKLVSGPIERSGNLLKQIESMKKESFEYDRVKSGLILILWGYFQKSVIADSFSVYVGRVYEQWDVYSGMTILFATIIFAFQLYADFAGYTNIAIGAACVLGYNLQENFRQPYLATSIKEFWRRWHISLSNWLRDYIYIPLGGNRKGEIHKYMNLLITFLVSGLWHGVSFNYVVWGLLHGVYQIAGSLGQKVRNKLMETMGLSRKNIFYSVVQRIGVFVWVNLAWIFFRASGLRSALKILHKCIFNLSIGEFNKDVYLSLHLSVEEIMLGMIFIILLILVDALHEKEIHIRPLIYKQPVVLRWSCYMGMVLILTFVEMRRCGVAASNFIYMQF